MKKTNNLSTTATLKQTFLKSYGSFLWALLLGALYPLGFSPVELWPITLFSMAGFFWLVKNQRQRFFMLGLTFGIGQFAVGTSWVYVSIHEFGHAAVPLALIITLFYVLYLALYPALFSVLYGRFFAKSKAWQTITAMALLWLITDGLRGWVFSGFPWLYAGYAFIDTSLANWAPVVGVHGVTLLAVVSAALVIELLDNYKNFKHWTVLVLIWVSSAVVATINWSEAVGEPVSVTLVQPNISQNLKWQQGYLSQTLGILKKQTENAKGEIIVWPEAAVPAFEDQLRMPLQSIAIKAAQKGQQIVTGVPLRNTGHSRYFNGAVVLSENSEEPTQQYFKRRLVPFGEYVPLQDLLRGLIEFLDMPMSAFSLGSDQQASMQLKKANLGMAICYEIAYPQLVYAQAQQSTALLTISNDAWFGASWGPEQHMQMARMRAKETALPLLRGTNNGITAIVDEKGKIISKLEQNIQGNLEGVFQPRKSSSWVLNYHSWWALVIVLSVSVLLLKKYVKESALE